MRKLIIMLLVLLTGMAASAQSADKLYEQGKALYDAEKYKEAVPKLKAAAEKGHKKAQYRLGRCYDKGRGVAENDAKAVEWYKKSAAQDYHKAQYELGKCYKNGEGVEKNREKAVELFAKAARQDNAEAQYALGKSYLKGKGIAADEKKARQWLRKAVSNPKGGKDILADIRKDAAKGDEDAKTILKMVK
jgi:hypothetical protein